MDGDKETRRERLECEAVDPASGKPIRFVISFAKLMSCRTSQGRIFEAAYTVPEVLGRPSAVFEGLRRESDEPPGESTGWLCYCGIPAKRYRPDGSEGSVAGNRVFLIFVNHDKIVYNWYWAKSSEEDRRLPIDYNERFVRNIL